ncbi:unnamed protein product [Amaranthus hypochondriacus]
MVQEKDGKWWVGAGEESSMGKWTTSRGESCGKNNEKESKSKGNHSSERGENSGNRGRLTGKQRRIAGVEKEKGTTDIFGDSKRAAGHFELKTTGNLWILVGKYWWVVVNRRQGTGVTEKNGDSRNKRLTGKNERLTGDKRETTGGWTLVKGVDPFRVSAIGGNNRNLKTDLEIIRIRKRKGTLGVLEDNDVIADVINSEWFLQDPQVTAHYTEFGWNTFKGELLDTQG